MKKHIKRMYSECTGEHAEEVWTLFADVPADVWRGP